MKFRGSEVNITCYVCDVYHTFMSLESFSLPSASLAIVCVLGYDERHIAADFNLLCRGRRKRISGGVRGRRCQQCEYLLQLKYKVHHISAKLRDKIHPFQGMLELLQTGELADVDVTVGGRVFRCHKAILGAR